jgi:hypothetical protein
MRWKAIDAERANSAAAEIAHEIESGLKNAGYYYGRPIAGGALWKRFQGVSIKRDSRV